MTDEIEYSLGGRTRSRYFLVDKEATISTSVSGVIRLDKEEATRKAFIAMYGYSPPQDHWELFFAPITGTVSGGGIAASEYEKIMLAHKAACAFS